MEIPRKIPLNLTFDIKQRICKVKMFCLNSLFSAAQLKLHMKQEFVRPRWPYDMRPSARVEKYMCHFNSLGGAT